MNQYGIVYRNFLEYHQQRVPAMARKFAFDDTVNRMMLENRQLLKSEAEMMVNDLMAQVNCMDEK